MRQRFHGNIKQRKIPKESRTLPVYGHPIRGDGLDHAKWYRCWNCGWLCNSDRDALGDSQSRSGVSHKDYAQQPDPGYSYPEGEAGISKKNQTAVLGDALMAGESEHDGSPKSVKNAIMVSSPRGCPLCGTLNWRGDY